MSGETIQVNGRPRRFADESLAQLLEGLGHGASSTGIAVAVNGAVVPRGQWSGTRIRPGDEIDVVGAVQGG